MRSRLVRRVPIWLRLLVTLGVPLIALVGVLGNQIREARESGRSLQFVLASSEVMRAAAALQSCVVQPETTHNGLTPATIEKASLLSQFTLSGILLAVQQSCIRAGADFDVALKRNAGVVPAGLRSAFAAERRALVPVLAGDLDDSVMARLTSARATADDALTDLFLSFTNQVQWFEYQGVIEIQRAKFYESSAVMVALAGVSDLTPAEISVYTGVRVNAVNRTRFGTNAQIREQTNALVSSQAYRIYSLGAKTATAIAARRRGPVDDAYVNQVGLAAVTLSDAIDTLSDSALTESADALRARAAQAEHEEKAALVIAVATIMLTLLAAILALQSILAPLRELTRRAKELASGQLDGEPVHRTGRDELAKLAEALESNAATLLHVNRQAQAMADGRLDDPSLEHAAPGPFGEVLHANVRAVQGQAARLRHDADHDPLTGLVNRAGLVRMVSRPAPHGVTSGESQRWLLYLDLDGFKQINDVHGHDQGDDVLRAVSERLLRAVRPGDVVARLGGDEFAVVLTVDTDAVLSGELDRVIDRISTAVRLPVPRRRGDTGHTGAVSVGVSIGRVLLPPAGVTFEEALAAADADMYVVKRAGKARRAANDHLVDLT